MKLNPDCIRDVMLELENKLSIDKQNDTVYRFRPIKVNEFAIFIENELGYSREDVVYSALQLWESGYIATNGGPLAYGHLDMIEFGQILYIKPKGHEFISSIHDKETWSQKIQPVLGKLGDVSLAIIETVAKGVTDSVIEKLIAPAIQNT